MSLPDDLHQASFAGVRFLCNVTETSGGRKDALHEFPNSDTQFIEDLGLKPRTYLLKAIINEDTDSSYVRKRNALQRVIESGVPSILIHPFYGIIANVKARIFTIKEITTRLGESEIDIEFTETTSTTTFLAQVSSSLLRGLIGKISNDTIASIVDRFLIKGSDGGNIMDSTTLLNKFVDKVRDGLITSPVDSSLLDVFTRQIDTFASNIPSLILNSSVLGTQLSKTIIDLAGLYPVAGDKIKVMKGFFNFGIDDVSIPQDTAARIQRQINRDVLNDSINVLTLSESYVAASQVTFGNIQELNDTERLLETQFRFIT